MIMIVSIIITAEKEVYVMTEQFPLVDIVNDENSVIYKIKAESGAYEDIPVSTHSYNMGELSKYIKQIEIQSGLTICLIDIPAEEEFEIDFQANEFLLGFGVTLECGLTFIYYKNGCELFRRNKTSNSLILSKSGNITGKIIKQKGQPARAVSISFDKNLPYIMFRNELQHIRLKYRPFFNDDEAIYEEGYPAPPTLLAAANAMLSCQYPSPKKELFLRSKVLEMFHYVVSEYFLNDFTNKGTTVLQPGEADKIRDIKDYLVEHLDMPPNIHKLARMSGLNASKLKAGFKEIFGTTIYGFIHLEKMAKAKLMLENGGHSVSDVAWDVGYTNVSHFIRAFKKSYEITPGQLLNKSKYNTVMHEIKSVV